MVCPLTKIFQTIYLPDLTVPKIGEIFHIRSKHSIKNKRQRAFQVTGNEKQFSMRFTSFCQNFEWELFPALVDVNLLPTEYIHQKRKSMSHVLYNAAAELPE